jgi:hypothetical protein
MVPEVAAVVEAKLAVTVVEDVSVTFVKETCVPVASARVVVPPSSANPVPVIVSVPEAPPPKLFAVAP